MKYFKLFFLFIFLFQITTSLNAHGPSRQKIVKEIEINAPIDDVWKLISDFSKFNGHPDVESIKSSGSDIGSTRVINFKNGKKISHSLEKLDYDKKRITWRIIETEKDILPVNSYSTTFMLKEIENSKVLLKIKTAFYRGFMGNDPPEHLNDENSKKKVNLFLNKSIEGIKSKF